MHETKLGHLTITAGPDGPDEREIRAQLKEAGFKIAGCAITYTDQARRRRLHYSLHWRARSKETFCPSLIDRLARQPGVLELEWLPNSAVGDLQGNEMPS